jgi:hypothetical protein
VRRNPIDPRLLAHARRTEDTKLVNAGKGLLACFGSAVVSVEPDGPAGLCVTTADESTATQIRSRSAEICRAVEVKTGRMLVRFRVYPAEPPDLR